MKSSFRWSLRRRISSVRRLHRYARYACGKARRTALTSGVENSTSPIPKGLTMRIRRGSDIPKRLLDKSEHVFHVNLYHGGLPDDLVPLAVGTPASRPCGGVRRP